MRNDRVYSIQNFENQWLRMPKSNSRTAELQYIRSFYEQERFQLLSRLQHVDQVIARLNGGTTAITERMAAPVAPSPTMPLAPAIAAAAPRCDSLLPSESEAALERKKWWRSRPKKAGRPKKRGPKSVWGNFILRRLRQCDRPLSYSELIRDAMVMHNLPAAKEKNAKASILNAAFRLRTHLGKVETVGMPGKKERFLVLTSWMEDQGALKAPYDQLLAEVVDTPMDDRGRKPRRPSATSRAESKVKARMKAAAPAPKKAPVQKAAAKKAPVKKAAVKKTVSRKKVAKTVQEPELA